jgi:hypothetical protein
MEGSEIPHVNYDQLVPGVVYAMRPEHLMSLEPALYLGSCPRRLQDGRVLQARAWAMPSRQDGCWRPTWAWGLKKMRWDDYMALPEADWPL